MNLNNCPRCGWKSLDVLKTYSYCANCNYNSEEDQPYEIPIHIQIWAEEGDRKRKLKSISSSSYASDSGNFVLRGQKNATDLHRVRGGFKTKPKNTSPSPYVAKSQDFVLEEQKDATNLHRVRGGFKTKPKNTSPSPYVAKSQDFVLEEQKDATVLHRVRGGSKAGGKA